MARLRASCSLLLCLMLVAPPLAATDEVDTAGEEGTGFDEFEYIETPDLVDSKSVGAAFLHEDPEPIDTSNMSISFIHPPPGYTFTKDPYVEVGGSGIPQGYSGMLYFGSGNPFPLSLQELPLNVVISDLAPGNYSLTVIILNHERQPTEVRAETNFEFLPPNVDVKKTRSSGKFDAKVFEMSQRFHLAEVVSSGSEDDNPFLDAFRSYAKGNVDCVRCEEDEIHVSDEIYAQVAVKLFSRSSRDIEQAVDIAYHCAEMDNYNCLFLALVFDNMHQRLGLLGHDDDKFPVLEKCAKARNPLCQLALGYRYRKGISVPESCDLAAMYYRLAGDVSVMFSQEDAGNAPLHNVRLLEYTAVSAEQEKAQVEELRVVQAEQGNADAAAAVAIDRYFGTSYTGSGNNEEDKKSAAQLFQQAAEKENALSLNNLGVMYQNGVGVEKNVSKAFEYFNKSAALGNSWGLNSLAHCYMYGLGVAANRTRGIEMLHRAAAKGNAQSHTNLGVLYRDGHGPCPPYCRDFQVAYYHFDQAALRGDVDALLFLGLMLKSGEFVDPNCDKATMAFKQCGERGPWSALLLQAFMAWNAGDHLGSFVRYRIAAELGFRTGQANVGYMYEHGIEPHVPQDPHRALYFYELAADQGDAVCRRKVGDMHYYGQGLEVNYTEAARHYEMNKDDPQSIFNLAYLTEHGMGVEQDREKAKELYRRAAASGGGRRLPSHASPAEFSELPAQFALARISMEEDVCQFAQLLLSSSSDFQLLQLLIRDLLHILADLGIVSCLTEEHNLSHPRPFLSVLGIGLEIWMSVLVGTATLFTAFMGPCFARGCAKRRRRRFRRPQGDHQPDGSRQFDQSGHNASSTVGRETAKGEEEEETRRKEKKPLEGGEENKRQQEEEQEEGSAQRREGSKRVGSREESDVQEKDKDEEEKLAGQEASGTLASKREEEEGEEEQHFGEQEKQEEESGGVKREENDEGSARKGGEGAEEARSQQENDSKDCDR